MKIVSITSVYIDGTNPWIYGLGDDNRVYHWNEDDGTWHLYVKKANV